MTENNIFTRFEKSKERLYIYFYSNFVIFSKNKNSYFQNKVVDTETIKTGQLIINIFYRYFRIKL